LPGLTLVDSALSISITMNVFSSAAMRTATTLNLQPAVLERFLDDPTSVREAVSGMSESVKPLVLEACNRAFQTCFRIAIAFASLAFVFAVLIPWALQRNVAAEKSNANDST
jgi:hypothetical protein